MSIRGIFANGADQLFGAFGDVPVTGTLKVPSGQRGYDTGTGAVTQNTTDMVVDLFLVRYKQREVDGDVIRVGDVKAIIRQSQTEAAPVAFNSKVESGGRSYEVRDVAEDPAGALWILQLRTVDE